MLDLNKLRKQNVSIIAIGAHQAILQSIIDFDYLAGKNEPSLIGVVASGKKYMRFFWGEREILIPVYSSVSVIPQPVSENVSFFINLTSARRTKSSTEEVLRHFPKLSGGILFAENVTEKDSLELSKGEYNNLPFIIGPASVGLLIPGILKLGAIGGTEARQLVDSHLFESGNVAVFSSSGGMTNELIRLVTGLGKRISFSLSFGGDRFPVLTPKDAFLAAEKDSQTEYIVYFGELGGYDEYELVELIKEKKVTKQVIAYIGGTISEMFETPPQFGHAKAMASRGEETAQAKAKALQKVGAKVTNSFTEFISLVKNISYTSKKQEETNRQILLQKIQNRKSALFINSISQDTDGSVAILGDDILDLARTKTYGHIVASMLLGKQISSKEVGDFTELILKLLVDHGPYVSGAVNTMISARAGKDLVSSLVSGLLTIGPRFGGAVNQAANHWLEGVLGNIEPYEYVEKLASQRKLISGIGHKKYRIDFPDPRVAEVLKFKKNIKNPRFTSFALAIEKITTVKKGNLILNVDGAMAAVLLDLLSEKEHLPDSELLELVQIEFFNAYFVLARSVGFTAHYLDQRRIDEGLFRLTPRDVMHGNIT